MEMDLKSSKDKIIPGHAEAQCKSKQACYQFDVLFNPETFLNH